MFQKLHTRLGDFWWYSLMLFVACRSGDVIQAFIGLWLVPKYVGASELGAVLPLQSLAALFAAPLGVLATVFAKYVNVYATRGERGKVKCFVRDVLVATTTLFALCIVLAYLVVPHFYERLHIASGLLTVLILAAGFTVNLASLFTSALQGLKLFKTITIQNLIGAPIRLVTLLVAMPFRALSGYVLGQTTPPATCSLLAAVSLHRNLRDVPCDTSWRRDLGEMLRYAGPVAAWTIGCTVYAAVSNTLIRQRMPEVESAAYYMLSRFAEIGTYLSLSIMAVLFPLAAEAHEKGQEDRRALRHAVIGSLAFGALLAVVFAVVGRRPFDLVAVWRPYAAYAPLLVPMALTAGLAGAMGSVVTYEMACRRFASAALVIGTTTAWGVLLVCFMGCEFFRGILPDAAVDAMAALRLAHLPVFVWASLAYAALQSLALLGLLRIYRHK